MTTFPCFASSFDFFNNPAVLDVATIIANFQTRVTGQVPAWTVPVAGTFKSPVDGVGRFYEVTLTRVSATQLNIVVTDQNAVTIINREIDIDVAGNGVNYYTGQFHAWIESLRAGTSEIFSSGIIDETPQAQNAIQDYVYANAYRNSGGAFDGLGGAVAQEFMLDNGASGMQQRYRSWGQSQGVIVGLPDGAGALQFFPADMFATLTGVNKWLGRGYQLYMCDNSIAPGTQKTIQIGNAGETGVFQEISGLTVYANMKVMVRVA